MLRSGLTLVLFFAMQLLTSTLGIAQTSVTLTIRAKGSGVPVSKAEVKGVGTDPIFTDKQGQVSLDVPAGEGAIEIYRHTYETLRIPYAELRVAPNYEAFLLPATPSDNEVIVRGSKRPEVSRKTVSIEEAAKVAPGGDPAQIPKLLPGVQSETFGPGIIVRGSGPADSRYQIDEWDVPFIFHRIGNISIIPDQLLSDVEFSSGGFGAQYGGATGGVVNLRTKSEVPERPTTEFRVNIPVYSSLFHERPISDGKAHLALSIRRSYLEVILPFILKRANQDGDPLTVLPVFGDAHLFYFRPLDDGHVKMLALTAYDGLQAAFPSEAATDEDGRGRFKLRDAVNTVGIEWKKAIDKEWSLTTAPQVARVSSEIDVVGNRIHLYGTVASLQAEASRRLSAKERLYVGGEVEYLIGEADVLAPKPDFSDPFFDFEEAPKAEAKVKETYYNLAAWVSVDQQLGDVLLTPGLRGFHSSAIKKTSADPRLSARYMVTESSALKGAVGRYSQSPEYRDVSDEFGNPDLNFIVSQHYILGFETDWDQLWTTDFQAFYKETRGLVRSDPVTNTSNDGSLLSHGFEAFIRRNLTQRWFGWISYTYSRTRERDNDQETFRNSQYDQTHVANFVTSYKLTGIWELGGRLIYHTGDTFTTVDDAVYNANLDKYQQRKAPGARFFDGRLPSYHELDVFANRDFLFDTWKMALRFGVEYLALQKQALGVQYNYDYSETEYFKSFGPIPYVEVRGTL